ncbi:SMC-Scp complex subunit ScpB [Peptoniphilus equinus]|uniref:SMC-Scp complex subunit ScpB n=1 Tax=Peptoniphilus equinus TaxID=3016343 RepID=A0ABY7QWK8_9FIRM|nr:SMC-Scp complex subunit ScpB [Peptoniphilus equinus]WBW50603.1 SMC-Scp complex subunit ScpB [Peptoniphilus equinus]
MNKNEVIGAIESILFAWSEPCSVKELKEALGVSEAAIYEAVGELEQAYAEPGRGLRLTVAADKFSLSTKPDYFDVITHFVTKKNIKNLSSASLEVLSIVAYKQPITKIEIESIRGVKCDSTLKNLTELGLIEITGKLKQVGTPNVYETTENFLMKFGLKSLEELPLLDSDTQETNFLEE